MRKILEMHNLVIVLSKKSKAGDKSSGYSRLKIDIRKVLYDTVNCIV